MSNFRKSKVSLKKVAGFAAPALALALLSGCQKQPGGQVVAVVNNQEITMQELNTEAQAAQLGADGADKPATASLLQRVIDRNLLADYARQEGLDRGPEYVARRRQLDQSLLADIAARKLGGPPVNPTLDEVNAFIASHPLVFADRQNLTLDQVRFATPQRAEILKGISSIPTIDGVIAKLESNGIQFAHGIAKLDTSTVDPSAARQILALKPGQTFTLSTGGQTYVSVVTGRNTVAVDRAEWPDIAANAIRLERMTKSMTASVEKLRSKAKIEYEPSFKPAK